MEAQANAAEHGSKTRLPEWMHGLQGVGMKAVYCAAAKTLQRVVLAFLGIVRSETKDCFPTSCGNCASNSLRRNTLLSRTSSEEVDCQAKKTEELVFAVCNLQVTVLEDRETQSAIQRCMADFDSLRIPVDIVASSVQLHKIYARHERAGRARKSWLAMWTR